ncbi:MAG: hypothetical protein KF812_00365, partial [Fimbriimonadaceae bacterium]|nr:hypothetical protein [Fimbriimonadaceae bacterium]
MASPRAQIWTAVAILGLTGALIGGHRLRTQLELGNPDLSTVSALSGPLASAQKDSELPETEAKFFYDLTQIMASRYKEPITDMQALGQGAVRGMIASLRQPEARYMDEDEFANYQRQLKGQFEGAGLDLKFLVSDEIEAAV